MVLDGFFGGFGWVWMVLGRFRWFWVVFAGSMFCSEGLQPTS